MKNSGVKQIYLADILAQIPVPYTVVNGADELYIDSLKPVTSATEYSLAFISKDANDKEGYLNNTNAAIIICDNSIAIPAGNTKCLIQVADPKLVFSIIGNHFFVPAVTYGIHPSAVIDPQAVISANCYIGPNCTIGKTTIGEGCYLHSNVTLHDNVTIGINVKIQAGTVIGAEGFGYNKDAEGVAVQFPHIGGVVIEDDVEIGANTCIDRGGLSDTIIKRGAKIDNLVHIAHNCVIGENAYVIAQAMIGGSTIIGDGAYIAPGASIRDQLKIGKNALVGLGAVVTKDIPDGEQWAGVPAKRLDKRQ